MTAVGRPSLSEHFCPKHAAIDRSAHRHAWRGHLRADGLSDLDEVVVGCLREPSLVYLVFGRPPLLTAPALSCLTSAHLCGFPASCERWRLGSVVVDERHESSGRPSVESRGVPMKKPPKQLLELLDAYLVAGTGHHRR